MIGWFKGKKTYIIAALSATVTILHMTGTIPDELYKSLLALLGSGAAATVAAKINRIEVKQTQFNQDVLTRTTLPVRK